MTDGEKIDLILLEMRGMKDEMQDMREDMRGMKDEMQDMKGDIQELKRHAASIELHIENTTDHSLQIIAENFVELTNKLNEAIPVADKKPAYEVKGNYLICEIDKIKKEVAGIKDKIA